MKNRIVNFIPTSCLSLHHSHCIYSHDSLSLNMAVCQFSKDYNGISTEPPRPASQPYVPKLHHGLAHW